MRTLELLAPARDAATAIAAIRHGADAVYIGAPAFGARAAASNSLDDIARVVEEARPFGVRVYVTLNTIIYENELDDAGRLVEELWRIGVDALIVQDMALLEMDLPPIDLHASTQTDARSADKIKWLSRAGFSQIVVPREFSLREIKETAEAAGDARIEVFVHGALCVSFSGDCHAGALLAGRSANRGECPQVCRLKFTLVDGHGKPVMPPDGGSPSRHWLSLADLNRLDYLRELVEAGASSFKIEGRLKSVDYVKNVTSAYSEALDEIVEESAGRFRRASYGSVSRTFAPDVARSFNRGFTPYFLAPQQNINISSWLTPKWVGRPIGKLIQNKGNFLKIRNTEPINNGDGIGYFTPDGTFAGFRVNRAENGRIYPAPGSNLPEEAGTVLYRNSDASWQGVMGRDDTARRTIAVDFTLRSLDDGRIAIDAVDERGCSVTVASREPFGDIARTDQKEPRKAIFERLGDTIYKLRSLDDRAGNAFIPSKALTALRREATAALDSAWKIRRSRPQRRPSQLSADEFQGHALTYHDNVANSLAEKFYAGHGAEVAEKAVEVDPPKGPTRIMTTRYCLRRELGCCLKTESGSRLPGELYLDAPLGRLKLDFDCKNCNMKISI